jgi:6-pyruvoyltetrahydropterin/6-carboxytetrahydropterin synthase
MISITKEFAFDAAHKLSRPELSAEANQQIFGKCCNVHGHTYRLRITVAGPIDASGMIIHFSRLKELVHELVLDRYDHTMLNELAEYQHVPPTAEVMAGHIFTLLDQRLVAQQLTLCSVVLNETPTSWATVTRDA